MDDMMTQDTPYVYLNKDYENDVSNIEAKPETDQRHEWISQISSQKWEERKFIKFSIREREA